MIPGPRSCAHWAPTAPIQDGDRMAEIRIGERTIEGDGRIEDIMRSRGERPDAFIFVMDGVPIPSDTEVGEGERVDAIRVASGG